MQYAKLIVHREAFTRQPESAEWHGEPWALTVLEPLNLGRVRNIHRVEVCGYRLRLVNQCTHRFGYAYARCDGLLCVSWLCWWLLARAEEWRGCLWRGLYLNAYATGCFHPTEGERYGAEHWLRGWGAAVPGAVRFWRAAGLIFGLLAWLTGRTG